MNVDYTREIVTWSMSTRGSDSEGPPTGIKTRYAKRKGQQVEQIATKKEENKLSVQISQNLILPPSICQSSARFN